MQRFAIQFTVYLESVADLIATNRGGQICNRFSGNLAIVKSLILQGLLHAFDRLIRSHQRNRPEKNQRGHFAFHLDFILTPLLAPYSALSPASSPPLLIPALLPRLDNAGFRP